MNINTFGFSYQGNFTDNGQPTQVIASNGPITVVLDITDKGLQLDARQTNVRADAPDTARIVLAATHWHHSMTKECGHVHA